MSVIISKYLCSSISNWLNKLCYVPFSHSSNELHVAVRLYFSADAVCLTQGKWFLVVAIIIYHIKIIIKNYHVFPEMLTTDFAVCPFLLPALQNRFLTQPLSSQNELGKASRLPGSSHAHWTISSLKLGQVFHYKWGKSQKHKPMTSAEWVHAIFSWYF